MKERTTGEILITVVTLTICITIICTGAGLFLLSILQPNRETDKATASVLSLINALIGVLAGYFAGSASKSG